MNPESLIHFVGALAGNDWLLFAVFFILSVLNIFFPPMPFEALILFSGYLSTLGLGSLWTVISAAILGSAAGSILLYRMVKLHGLSIIEKTPLKRLLRKKIFKRTKIWLEKYGLLIVLPGRLLPGMNLCLIILAGLNQIKFHKIFPLLLLVSATFFTVLFLAGQILAEKWRAGLIHIQRFSTGFLIFGLIMLIGWVVWRHSHKKKSSK